MASSTGIDNTCALPVTTLRLAQICTLLIILIYCVQQAQGLKLDYNSEESKVHPVSQDISHNSEQNVHSNMTDGSNSKLIRGHPKDKRTHHSRHHRNNQHSKQQNRKSVPPEKQDDLHILDIRSQKVNSGKGYQENDNPNIRDSKENLKQLQVTRNSVEMVSKTTENPNNDTKQKKNVSKSPLQNKDGNTPYKDDVTKSSVPTNTISSPEVIPNDPDTLKNLVLSLQSQLMEAQTSQVYTRSILNVVQEKQAAQDNDMQTLKDAILVLTIEQQQDRLKIETLEKMASDNAWGISDLKTGTDQMRMDFMAFKALQLAHNETMLELESFALNNEMAHDNYHRGIKHLQHEVMNIKDQLQQDKLSLSRLADQFEQATRDRAVDRGATTARYSKTDSGESRYNNIPVIVPTGPDQSYYEGSGDKSNEVSKEFDKLASNVEEKHNLIGHHISKILAKERKMEKDMERMHRKVNLYQGELSKVYRLFFNLSLQLIEIEKKVNDSQHEQFQQDIQNLKHSFMNLTQHISHLQKYGYHKNNYTGTLQYHEGIGQMENMENVLDEYNNRLRYMENSLVDTKASNQQNYIIMNNQFSKLNDTVKKMGRMLSDHNSQTSDVFQDVSAKLMDFNTRIRHNDDRVTRMEVKVLNASLHDCEKTNTDLIQDNYLNNLDKSLVKMDRKFEEVTDKLSKMERDTANLYEITDNQEHTMSKIKDKTGEITTVLPSVKGLQKEVKNFIMQLPADCSEIGPSQQTIKNGSYLIHPRKSPGSAWVPCEFTGDDTWTIIQRRVDGSLSFAKSWDEYKYGFGDANHEFWIGNENLHFLTSQENYMLHIDMWDLDNKYWYAEYNNFKIDAEDDKFSLKLSGFKGNATDAMKYSNYMPFSTEDQDNDVSSTHCAKFYTAGWWYKHCQYGNLNGRYTVGIVWFNHDFDEWVQMQRTVMKIRPNKFKSHYHDRRDNSTEEKEDD